ncbi:MAG TPA: hypothetical protein VFI08_03300 [Spirochaetia bacterium]|nr:hypothetical protein [Spirochaetia bacterium]
MLHFPLLKFWNEDELYALQVSAVSRLMKVDTPYAVEATVEIAKFLCDKGLDSDNYPLFLELLRDENRFVIEALIGKNKAFDLFTRVQPNPYIIEFCLTTLRSYAPGGVNDRTLEMIFGILYRNYHSAREGNMLHRLTIEDVNAVGKFLDKSRDQNDPINRFILDILADIAEYRSINNEDPALDKNSSHATAIRNAFFDTRRSLSSVMPAEILVRKNYDETLVKPRSTRKFTETAKPKGK